MRDLNEMDTQLVTDSWPYSKPGGSLKYIRRLIMTMGGVVIVIPNPNGSGVELPIAWALRYDSGAIGFLHVIPEYRRLGISREVLRVMIKRCLEEDNDTPVIPPFSLHCTGK